MLDDYKYGIGMNDSELQLTLLRAAASPEMRADDGDFLSGPVVDEAYALNVPLFTEPGNHEQ